MARNSRALYGGMALLFTGDAEVHTERAMIARGHDLRARVLQLGHHGSRTSSSEEFLRAVSPEVAVYSAGKGNLYGHPHAEPLDRLERLGIPVYGTDIHGTIVVVTDGTTSKIQLSRDAPPRAPPAALTGCRPGQIDINQASAEELQRIAHIGEARAAEVVRLRPFRSLTQLTRIRGIGQGRLGEIRAQGLACVAWG
jgi:competence protein ComEC